MVYLIRSQNEMFNQSSVDQALMSLQSLGWYVSSSQQSSWILRRNPHRLATVLHVLIHMSSSGLHVDEEVAHAVVCGQYDQITINYTGKSLDAEVYSEKGRQAVLSVIGNCVLHSVSFRQRVDFWGTLVLSLTSECCILFLLMDFFFSVLMCGYHTLGICS